MKVNGRFYEVLAWIHESMYGNLQYFSEQIIIIIKKRTLSKGHGYTSYVAS